MQARRVVMTGAGTVNALGGDVAVTLAAMRAGVCGIGPLDLRDVDRLQVQIGGQVRNWDEGRFGRDLTLYDRFTQFGLVAAAEAVAQAGITFDPARTGVIMGTAGGGLGTTDDNFRAVYAEGKNRVHPLTVPRLMHSAVASHIAMAHGAQGAVFSVASACASAN
ncbi:MAG: beta-ketoacyl synthase N-terminal-like domain-containing protein, partial [Paracoccaceae bacterium]